MRGNLLVRRARVILPDGVLCPADVLVRNGNVVRVSTERLEHGGELLLEADDAWLLPGLIDVHCDQVEKEIQPRPNVQLPHDLALGELDRKLALCGITTMFHGVSFGAGLGVRSNEGAAALVRAIARFGRGPTLVRHHAHLRFEVSNWPALPLVAELIDEGSVGMLSLMDHTPGQGQFRDPKRFRDYIKKTFWAGEDELDRIVAELAAGRARVTDDDLRALCARADAARIPIAGHDPDNRGAIDLALERGAGMVEFPITLDVARYAAELRVSVCVGAPNVLNGGSHDGNLSAREAIGEGAADILCSDYYPSGLLPAVFRLVHDGVISLSEAVALATANAAASAGLRGVAGAIAPGYRADLILVSEASGRPNVEATIVGGEVVLTTARRSAATSPFPQKQSGGRVLVR